MSATPPAATLLGRIYAAQSSAKAWLAAPDFLPSEEFTSADVPYY